MRNTMEDFEDFSQFTAPFNHDAPFHEPPLFSPLQKKIVALVFANLATIIILGLLYLNYILFESYFFVMLYAFLISEALWDTKMMAVNFIRHLNDTPTVSPKQMLIHMWQYPFINLMIHRNTGLVRWSGVLAVTVFGCFLTFATLSFPLMVTMLASVGVFAALLAYVLDRRLFFLSRIHRIFMEDDTWVALVMIVMLVVSGMLITASFAVLSIRDANTAIDVVSTSVSKFLEDEAAQNLWAQVTANGQAALKSWVESVEGQYKHTGWGPMVEWIAKQISDQVHDQSSSAHRVTFEWDGTFVGLWPALHEVVFDALPEWCQNKTLMDLGQSIYSDPSYYINQELLETLPSRLNNVLMGAYGGLINSSAIVVSVLLSLIDFGVRVGFLLAILFFLLSSKENILHSLLKEFAASSEVDVHVREDGGEAALDALTCRTPSGKVDGVGRSSSGGTTDSSFDGMRTRFDGPRTPFDGPRTLFDSGRTPSDRAWAAATLDTAGRAPFDNIDTAPPALVAPTTSGPLSFELKLRATIEGVFMLPVKMASLHALTTFALFWTFEFDFMFFASSLCLIFTLFPVIYPQWICMPWCLIYMYQGSVAISITVQVLHYLILSSIDDHLLSRFQIKTRAKAGIKLPPEEASLDTRDYSKRNYITGMSLFFGVNAFGAQGVLLGPLLVCLGVVAYEMFTEQVKDQQQRQLGVSPRARPLGESNSAGVLHFPSSGQFKVPTRSLSTSSIPTVTPGFPMTNHARFQTGRSASSDAIETARQHHRARDSVNGGAIRMGRSASSNALAAKASDSNNPEDEGQVSPGRLDRSSSMQDIALLEHCKRLPVQSHKKSEECSEDRLLLRRAKGRRFSVDDLNGSPRPTHRGDDPKRRSSLADVRNKSSMEEVDIRSPPKSGGSAGRSFRKRPPMKRRGSNQHNSLVYSARVLWDNVLGMLKQQDGPYGNPEDRRPSMRHGSVSMHRQRSRSFGGSQYMEEPQDAVRRRRPKTTRHASERGTMWVDEAVQTKED